MERCAAEEGHHSAKGSGNNRGCNCGNGNGYYLPSLHSFPVVIGHCVLFQLEDTIDRKQNGKRIGDMNLDELDELEDSEDEEVLQQYRQKRLAEMRDLASKAKFGTVGEISGVDYVDEVTKAGEGIHVVLHLYKGGIPHCAVLNQYMVDLAKRYPQTKFLKAIYSTCLPNFPEKNLPSIFCYFEGNIRKQFLGSVDLRGPTITADEFEYLLGKVGSIPTEITSDPRPKIKDKMLSDLSDNNDW